MSRRPIKLLLFTNGVVRAGAEEHMLVLLRGLDRELFRLHLVCPPQLLESMRQDLPGDVDVIPLEVEQPYHLGPMLRLARVLMRRRIDILHSHMFYSSLCASPVGWACRVPVIVETSHGREAWRKGWLKGRFFVDRLAGRCVKHYIAVSSACAQYLVEEKGLPRQKILAIPNGCDLRRFLDLRPPDPGVKRDLRFDEADPVLVVLGRLEPQKGHAILMKAMPAIRSQFPTVRLVCVGAGSLRESLEAQVRSLGLEDAVRFVGYRSDVPQWLAMADVSVLPSLWEGMPLTAIESLAAGRAMVATAVDGTGEVVLHGKTGLTVAAGSVAELAGAICRLLREPETRERLGRAGRAWVLQHFTQESQIQRTQQFYIDVWNQHLQRAQG